MPEEIWPDEGVILKGDKYAQVIIREGGVY